MTTPTPETRSSSAAKRQTAELVPDVDDISSGTESLSSSEESSTRRVSSRLLQNGAHYGSASGQENPGKAASTKKKEKGEDQQQVTAPHPKYEDMIKDVLLDHPSRRGLSRQMLKKTIRENYPSLPNFDTLLNQAIRRGVEKGVFEQPSGPSGVVKLSREEKDRIHAQDKERKAKGHGTKDEKPRAEKRAGNAGGKIGKKAATPSAKARTPARPSKAAPSAIPKRTRKAPASPPKKVAGRKRKAAPPEPDEAPPPRKRVRTATAESKITTTTKKRETKKPQPARRAPVKTPPAKKGTTGSARGRSGVKSGSTAATAGVRKRIRK